MSRRPRIGVSACFLYGDPERNLFRGKTLVYIEQSMARWLLAAGAFPCLLPVPHGAFAAADLLEGLDGLLLQAGDDVAPQSYGQQPLRPEWEGDAPRDAYERELIRLALARQLPLLGICRGLQMLNVALGGSLLQDIATQHPDAELHRDPVPYDRHGHRVELLEGSRLRELYRRDGGWVNSVHHQAIDRLGAGLVVEARSAIDGVIEAVRLPGGGYCSAVQWHPEFMGDQPDSLPPAVLMGDFLAAVRRSMDGNG